MHHIFLWMHFHNTHFDSVLAIVAFNLNALKTFGLSGLTGSSMCELLLNLVIWSLKTSDRTVYCSTVARDLALYDLRCARFPEFVQNFSERQNLWNLCSVDFHTFTLQLPIQTQHWKLSKFQQNEHIPI